LKRRLGKAPLDPLQTLTVINHQKVRRVKLRLLRRIAWALMLEIQGRKPFDVGIRLVHVDEITRLNETFLHHKGATDVITFDYSDGSVDRVRPILHGEIVICVEMAIEQARQFHTAWPCELVRYIVHGVLHLMRFDDRHTVQRRRMKREEDRLLDLLNGQFDFEGLLGTKSARRTRRTGAVQKLAQVREHANSR